MLDVCGIGFPHEREAGPTPDWMTDLLYSPVVCDG